MSITRVALRSVDSAQQLQRHAESINGLIDGKQDVISTCTLAAGVTTTTVTDNKFESTMALFFTPTTANAAGALAGMYVSTRSEGSFVLTHANTATVDRTFLYSRFG